MTGITRKMLAGAFLAGGLAATGCHHGGAGGGHNNHGDPCWPERYSNESRAATVAQFQPQVENGHILDQTIWNEHFEYSSDKLTGMGMDKLDQLARRRPQPDQRLFLQTSRDIPYDAEKPTEYASKRVELDLKRTEAVQRYLKATLTGRDVAFDIQVHDPAKPGINYVEGYHPRLHGIPAPGTNPDTRGIGVVNAPNQPSAAAGGTAGGAGPAAAAPPPPPAQGSNPNSGSMGTRN